MIRYIFRYDSCNPRLCFAGVRSHSPSRLMTWQGREWEKWGQRDPYFAVISHDEYHADRVDDAARQAFFAEGEDEIATTLDDVRRVTESAWRPRSTLDFGCGVGRMTMPLARISE